MAGKRNGPTIGALKGGELNPAASRQKLTLLLIGLKKGGCSPIVLLLNFA